MMSHNTQIFYKSLEKIVLEKPKLLRSDSPIKYVIDTVRNNNNVKSHVAVNDDKNKTSVYQLLKMYYKK